MNYEYENKRFTNWHYYLYNDIMSLLVLIDRISSSKILSYENPRDCINLGDISVKKCTWAALALEHNLGGIVLFSCVTSRNLASEIYTWNTIISSKLVFALKCYFMITA